MKKLILILIILIHAISFSQIYPKRTIRELQFVPDSSLANGNDASARVGDTVQVTGVVMVRTLVHPSLDRRPIMWAGARWQSYIRDTNYSAVDWAGLNIIQDDTTSAGGGSLIDLLDTCQIVTVTGIVQEFSRQTQINVIKTIPIQFHSTKQNRGLPLEVIVADFSTGTTPKFTTGEKYEGMYVIIKNVVTADRNTTTGAFNLVDAQGNKLYVHDQSGYFTKRTHALRTWDPPLDGTTITSIRGVIGHSSTGYSIRPMYVNDVQIGQSPPSISNIRRSLHTISSNQTVKVTAKIYDVDLGGQVLSAKLKYRVNGGNVNELNMTSAPDSTWSAVIPGVTDSSLVDFYIWAQDNDGMISTNPQDTVKGKYFYLVLNRALKIQDIQYSPFGSGFSGYNNYRVTISGVVTADTTDLQGDGNQIGKRVYIQNGQGPWSGIWVFGTKADSLKRGQLITVSGLINENNSNTRVDSITSLTIQSNGNPLPTPEYIKTSILGTTTGGVANGNVDAEKWEGVLVKNKLLTVDNENADGNPGPNGGGNSNFGEILVKDTTNVVTRVELQEGNHLYHNYWDTLVIKIPGNIRIRKGDKFAELIGIPFYSFGNYKLVPRKGDDFIGYQVDVNENQFSIPEGFVLYQNYPNPFNPVTRIKYSIASIQKVSLKIYDILGSEVAIRQLPDNEVKEPGYYEVEFDGNGLSSGVYFYQLRAGEYVSTKKFILMK